MGATAVPVRLIWQAGRPGAGQTPRARKRLHAKAVYSILVVSQRPDVVSGRRCVVRPFTRDRWEDGSRRLPGQRQARVCRSKVSCALGCLLNLPHGRVHGAAGCWAVRPARNTHHRSQGLVVRSFVPPFREAQQVQYGPERPAAYLIVKDSGKKNIYYSYFGSD